MNIHAVRRRFGRAFGPRAAALSATFLGFVCVEAFGQLVHEGQSFAVIDASQVPTAMSGPAGDSGIASFGFDDHMLAHADGACTSCGPAGGYGGGGGGGYGAGYGGGMPSLRCDPFWYATVEGLYLRRFGDVNYTLARDFRLDQFDYEWAPRITIGSVPDCVHGFEVSFTGMLNWDMRAAAVSPGNTLESLLVPDGVTIGLDALDTFSGAGTKALQYDAEYWSVEANRTFNGWGVSKYLYGFRYIDYSEKFRYLSVDPVDGTGLLRSDTQNYLVGAQVGLDLLYPVARHAYADFRGRAGAFLNIADSRVDLINDGTRLIGARPDDKTLAGVLEIGTGLRYELGESLSIRGGLEAWYLSRVAAARNQIRNPVTSRLGRSLNTSEDIVMFGLTFGAEFKY